MYGHTIESIKKMTSTQLNIYMAAINEIESEKSLLDLYINRVSAHAEAKDFKKFEGSFKKKKPSSATMPKEWMED